MSVKFIDNTEVFALKYKSVDLCMTPAFLEKLQNSEEKASTMDGTVIVDTHT